ncbi:CNNM domain-containing protein [Neptuniibacter sp. QD37_11]|uniref:CNNM domain-containing protein n=1 Tax=Neptuniibacter sp. QD37_11 TaxID=3398209 RepID=UPI0039F4D5C1
MTLLLCTILFVLTSSAFLSLSEASVVALNLIKGKAINMKIDTLSSRALLKVLTDKKRYLSTIIILNTAVNVGGGILIGILSAAVLNDWMNTAVSIIFTLSILYGAEMVPKLYASSNPEEVGLIVAKPLIVLEVLIRPMLWLSRKICAPFLKSGGTDSITMEDVKFIIEESETSGMITSTAKELMNNTLHLNEKTAADIMTCRTEIECLSVDTVLADNKDAILNCKHKRLAVVNADGMFIGSVHKAELLSSILRGECGRSVRDFMMPIIATSTTTPLSNLLAEFETSEGPIAVVFNDDNEPLGALAIEDITHALCSGYCREALC